MSESSAQAFASSSCGDYSLLYVKMKHLTHNSVSSMLRHVAAVISFLFSPFGRVAREAEKSFERLFPNAHSFPTMPFFFLLRIIMSHNSQYNKTILVKSSVLHVTENTVLGMTVARHQIHIH